MHELNRQHCYRVLVIDDDITYLNYLSNTLHMSDHCEITTAISASEGMQILKEVDMNGELLPFDVILLDINMPEINGIEACKRIKSDPFLDDIPIIMLTGDSRPEILESAFNAGASDYVTKPFVKIELMARLRSVFEQSRLKQELKALAFRDALTGLANRSFLIERINSEIAEFRRNQTSFALLYLDLDNFKPLNDELGHEMGDYALLQVASRLRQRVREVDTVARLGGDEFVILLTQICNRTDVLNMAGDLITSIREPIVCNGVLWNLGVSVGVVLSSDVEADVTSILKAADEAMYMAKKRGGNDCCCLAISN
ncbi:MAG: diguanylate cyclase [Gammaproteobacteria bacterium]|nr:diguanylate cyclase [Gammaproteobacteria bacterium]